MPIEWRRGSPSRTRSPRSSRPATTATTSSCRAAKVSYQQRLGPATDLTLQARLADESAARSLAHDGFNELLGGSGTFAANGPVVAGRYATASAELSGGGMQLEWKAGLEGTAGARRGGRGWVGAAARTSPESRLGVTVTGWAGMGAGDSIPQREFRLGGLKTLRGYPAGALRGASAWTGSLDLGWSHRDREPGGVRGCRPGRAAARAVHRTAGLLVRRRALPARRPAASGRRAPRRAQCEVAAQPHAGGAPLGKRRSRP